MISGWNEIKPVAEDRAIAAKTYLMERAHPNTLLLGNSRIEVGFNPASPAWPSSMQPVFNAGLGGQTLAISAKMLEDALAVAGLKHVLVGVDFLDFLRVDPSPVPSGPIEAGPEQTRMRVRSDLSVNPDAFAARAQDMLGATLTLDAITGSVTTILAQHTAAPATMTQSGFKPLNEYVGYVKLHGFRDLFDQKQRDYVARFRGYPHPDFIEPYRTPSFRYLREIVTTALDNDCSLTLIIYPYHAWVLDLLREDGLWESAEAWKRALVKVVASLDPMKRVRIFDFSGYNKYSTEPPPLRGDLRTELHWYWEPGHFRPALGDQIIGRLYNGEDKGFGRELSSETVDQVIAAVRREAENTPRSMP
jgi:hypothetical protein